MFPCRPRSGSPGLVQNESTEIGAMLAERAVATAAGNGGCRASEKRGGREVMVKPDEIMRTHKKLMQILRLNRKLFYGRRVGGRRTASSYLLGYTDLSFRE